MNMNNFLGIFCSVILSTFFISAFQANANDDSEIVFKDKSGKKILKSDLKNATGVFNYEIYGIENVSKKAQELHIEARKYGEKGNYKKSIELLLKASELAKKWAYPPYDLGFTYLLQNDDENALKYYKIADKIEPKGFYTSKTAVYTLEKEKKGLYKKGLYKAYLSLEWINDPKKKLNETKLLISAFPNYAPLWKNYAKLLKGKEREKALDNGLSLETDQETKGMLLINKAIFLNSKNDSKKAKEILGKIILDDKSTFGNIELAKFVLKSIKL